MRHLSRNILAYRDFWKASLKKDFISFMNLVSSENEFVSFNTRNMVSTLVEDVLKKAGISDLFDESFDYDKFFMGLFKSSFRKFPFSLDDTDQFDIFVDVLIQTVTKDTAKKFNPSKNDDISKYFGFMFNNRLKTALTLLANRKVKEKREFSPSDGPGEDGEGRDDFIDRTIEDKQRPQRPDEKLEYEELIDDARHYLEPEKDGAKLVEVFDLLREGYNNREVAKKLSVSPAIITRRLKRLREALLDFAEDSGNITLFHELEKTLDFKKHSEDPDNAPSFADLFTFGSFSSNEEHIESVRDRQSSIDGDNVDIIDEDEPLQSVPVEDLQGDTPQDEELTEASHAPVGDVSKIQVISTDNLLKEEHILEELQDAAKSAEDIESRLSQFGKFIDDQDDILEEGDQIVGIKNLSDTLEEAPSDEPVTAVGKQAFAYLANQNPNNN